MRYLSNDTKRYNAINDIIGWSNGRYQMDELEDMDLDELNEIRGDMHARRYAAMYDPEDVGPFVGHY